VGADHRDVALERVLAKGAARAEGEEPGVAGEHQRAQIFRRLVVVADEGDAADADLLVLFHRVAHDHRVAALRDDLARDFGEEKALLRVHVADLLDPAAHGGLAQHRVVFDLDRLEQLFVVELEVAVDFDGRDARTFAHDEAQHHALVAPLEVHLDVVEEARSVQLPHVLGKRRRRERIAAAKLQVAFDVVGRHPAVARHRDLDDRHARGLLGLGRRDFDARRRGLGERGRRCLGRGLRRSGGGRAGLGCRSFCRRRVRRFGRRWLGRWLGRGRASEEQPQGRQPGDCPCPMAERGRGEGMTAHAAAPR
jgi:hypothetical protein